MSIAPELRFVGTVVNATDPDALAAFYEALLGWPRFMDESDWIAIRPADGGTAIAFQLVEDLVTPTWPSQPGRQQATLHLDFVTADLERSVEHAIACGAVLAELQTLDDERVLLDPAGNPFCLIHRPANP